MIKIAAKLAAHCGKGGLLWVFAITLIWAYLSANPPEFFERLERRTFDTLVHFAPALEPGSRYAVVLGGERSVQEIGQWPWKRSVHASLIDRLRESRLVMLDILFTERSSPEADARLIQAVKSHGRVIGCTYGIPRGGRIELLPILPGLEDALLSVGAVNSERDIDSVFRQGLMGLKLKDGGMYPSLSARAVMQLFPDGVSVDLRARPPLASFLWKKTDLEISKSDYVKFWVGYPSSRVAIYEYVDVLNGTVPARAFRDSVVIVGMAAAGTYDVVAMSDGRVISGSEFVMNCLLSLLSPFSLGRSPLLFNTAWGACIVLLAALFGFLSPKRGFSALLALLFSLAGVVAFAFLFGHIWLPFFSPLAGGLAAYAASVVINLHYSALRQLAERRDLFFRIIGAMAVAIGKKDSTTGNHSIRVAGIARELGEWLKMPKAQLEDLQFAATIHDVGKIGVSDLVLNKPGRFKDFEFTQMKSHPTYGVEIVKDVNLPEGVVEAIGQHHRHVDGGGYPRGEEGHGLHPFSRIIQIADVYDALTSERQYKAAWPEAKACDLLWENRGSEFDADYVEIFLSYKAPRWWKSADGWTRLMCAAKHLGDPGTLRARISERPDVNEPNAEGTTALMFAAACNQDLGVAELLLKSGADPRLEDRKGYTALAYARAFNSNEKVVKRLEAAAGEACRERKHETPPAPPSAREPAANGRGPAHDPAPDDLTRALIGRRPLREIELLLRDGALLASGKDGKTPLMYAAEYAESPAVPSLLLKMGVPIDERNAEGKTALMYAAARNEEPLVVTALLFAGADVLAVDEKKRTALMYAASENANKAVLQILLLGGAEIDALDDEGKTALAYAAAFNENAGLIEELLTSGADVKRKDENGFTALTHSASRNKNPGVLVRLLEGGADAGERDRAGNSVLYHAACNPHNPEAMLKALLEYDVAISDGEADRLLIEVVADKTDPAIFTRLIEKGFPVDTRNADGATLLSCAMRRNPNPDVVRILLELGATPG